uniref:Proteasome activator PA28 C-terminal domain-containing protein n=1 Tax=Glossina brevipalpis TaxID=37001 RepID=A0A1A9X206_9MUSC
MYVSQVTYIQQSNGNTKCNLGTFRLLSIANKKDSKIICKIKEKSLQSEMIIKTEMDIDTKTKVNADNEVDLDSNIKGKLDVYSKTEIDSVTQDKLSSVGKANADDMDSDSKINLASKPEVITDGKVDAHAHNEPKIDAEGKTKAVADSKIKVNGIEYLIHLQKRKKYKEFLTRTVEQIIKKGLPQELLQLAELLATPILQDGRLTVVSENLNIPATLDNYDDGEAILPEDIIPTGLLRMWIRFMIPKIDGFRVLNRETKSVETLALYIFKQISDYFTSRMEILSKIANYPRIDDYRRAIIDIDEKQWSTLSMLVCEIENEYLELYDLVKNYVCDKTFML